jgi:hypothetical protein
VLLDLTGCQRVHGGVARVVLRIGRALERRGVPHAIAVAPTGGLAVAPDGRGVFFIADTGNNAVRVCPVGEGDAQAVRGGQTGGDTVDHIDLYAKRLQMLFFFTGAAEDQRVAAFEAHHVFTGQSLLRHEFFNESLRR